MVSSALASTVPPTTRLLLALTALALGTRTNERAARRAYDCYFVITAVVTDSVSHHIVRIVTSGARRNDASPDSTSTCRTTHSPRVRAAERAIREYLASGHEQRRTEWISIANENPERAAEHLVLLARSAGGTNATDTAGSTAAFDGIELIPLGPENGALALSEPALPQLPPRTLDDSTHARCERRSAAHSPQGTMVRWIC